MAKKSLVLTGKFKCEKGHFVYGRNIEEGNAEDGWICPILVKGNRACGLPLVKLKAQRIPKKQLKKV